ncbi:MAG TPA: hypothetical protein VKH42_03885 [Vicinamibacterales bacterium]|nr:hypothetical protein [Vicinamibacterales bacterium]
MTDTTTAVNFHACAYNSAGTSHSHVTVSGGSVVGVGTVDVTVLAGALLTVQIVPVPLTPINIGTSVVFTATVTSAGPVPSLLQWEWDTNGDGTYDLTIASAANPYAQSITFGTTGVQTVKVRVTDTATGRSAIGTVLVTVS